MPESTPDSRNLVHLAFHLPGSFALQGYISLSQWKSLPFCCEIGVLYKRMVVYEITIAIDTLMLPLNASPR